MSCSTGSCAPISQDEKRRRRLVERRIFALQQSFYPPQSVTVSPEHMKACLRCFLPSHYCEIVEERGVGKLCGYPLCGNPSRDGDKWFRQDKKLFTKKYLFCSLECNRASEFVERQISTETVMFRKPLPHLYNVKLWHEESDASRSVFSLAATSDGMTGSNYGGDADTNIASTVASVTPDEAMTNLSIRGDDDRAADFEGDEESEAMDGGGGGGDGTVYDVDVGDVPS